MVHQARIFDAAATGSTSSLYYTRFKPQVDIIGRRRTPRATARRVPFARHLGLSHMDSARRQGRRGAYDVAPPEQPEDWVAVR